jgi:hypothetical protein
MNNTRAAFEHNFEYAHEWNPRESEQCLEELMLKEWERDQPMPVVALVASGACTPEDLTAEDQAVFWSHMHQLLIDAAEPA